MELSLVAGTPQTIQMPAKTGEITVGTAGTWSGTLEVGYVINSESETYLNGTFTANTDFVLRPAADAIVFTLTGTGTAEIKVTQSKWAK